MAAFAQRLKELRKEHSHTQKQLAAGLGVGQSTIANYEQSIRFPDEEMLHRVADYFSISLDYLLGRTDVQTDITAVIDTNNMGLDTLRELYSQALREGKKREASEVLMSAAAWGVGIRDLYINVLETSLKEIGTQWESGKIDVAEEHFFTAATIQIMSQLYHYLKPDSKRGTSFVV